MDVRTPCVAAAAAAAVLFATACNTPTPAPTVPAVAPPVVAATKAEHLPGLHNVVAYTPTVIGGGQPEGEEGLVTLKGMGIKTVVSVDGATPDVATAEKLGLQYVHLPISYDTVTPERQQQLALALANCDATAAVIRGRISRRVDSSTRLNGSIGADGIWAAPAPPVP